MMQHTAEEKAKALVQQRGTELGEAETRVRQLRHQADRLASRLKELELAAQNGSSPAKKELRELTTQSLELELELANAKFAHEDAQDRLDEANQQLEAVKRAAMSERLAVLSTDRLDLVETINKEIDTLESAIERFNAVVSEQVEIAQFLGIDRAKFETENGPVIRLVRLLDSHGRQSESWSSHQGQIRTLQTAIQKKDTEIEALKAKLRLTSKSDGGLGASFARALGRLRQSLKLPSTINSRKRSLGVLAKR